MNSFFSIITVITMAIASVSILFAIATAINAILFSRGERGKDVHSNANKPALKMQLMLISIWDVIISLIAVVSILPVYLIVGTMICAFTHETPIDVEKVLGKGKKEISIYRFRTGGLSKHKKSKALCDFLIKSGLRELPLLINIVKGDISTFGLVRITYSELPRIQEYVPNIADVYMNCRPGLVSIRELRWNVMPAKSNVKEYYEYINKVNKEFIEKRSIRYLMRMMCRVIVMAFRPYDGI